MFPIAEYATAAHADDRLREAERYRRSRLPRRCRQGGPCSTGPQPVRRTVTVAG